MRFIDEAKIQVYGGHGGPGAVSFRREKYVPRGGPDGGDGGRGGDVIFAADIQLSTLQDFRIKRTYRAGNGMPGSGANKTGRDGESVTIRVPVGTVIRDQQSGELLKDFQEDGESWIACKGGRGGKGNSYFVTSTHQAPKYAQPGESGEHRAIQLELKLLADVGIIGFPNAGKSTLISRISAARPKIADYAFTTLVPNLGVVSLPDLKSFVVADIPGLVEGAHQGAGLGHKFLRHIERTRVFIHLLDGAQLLELATQPTENLEPPERKLVLDRVVSAIIQMYTVIREELGLFNEALLHKPEIVAINKLDLLESDSPLVQEARVALRQRLNAIRGRPPIYEEPYLVSAVSGQGINQLMFAIQEELEAHSKPKEKEQKVALPDELIKNEWIKKDSQE